jgi:hypothetical protein
MTSREGKSQDQIFHNVYGQFTYGWRARPLELGRAQLPFFSP